ncbi:MAG: Gfo/Idh/MocA family oxidoreductase [Kiritimatiellae bacterium]|nr:Gfo/Idh/MocA family oxidoreductase [Kiritimatiellia bacterium]
MKTEKIVRWGMIGCGSVAETKSAPAYQMVAGFELVAVMCRHIERAKDYALRHNVAKFYDDAFELIADNDVDAVYIATPPDSHLEYGLMVAAAGKICCVEKPMAVCYDDALKIYRAFEDNGLKLFVAYYRRSLPRFQHVKSWLGAGAIGDIRHVSWSFSRKASELDLSGEYNWRTDEKIAPGGYFDDLASHGLDLIVYFLGKMKQVSGFGENQAGLYAAKDAVVASWVHDSGVTGTGYWNFNCEIHQDSLEIFGDRGKIQLSVFGNDCFVLTSGDKRKKVCIDNPVPVQLPFVEMIRDDLYGVSMHVSTGCSGCYTSWVLSEILN